MDRSNDGSGKLDADAGRDGGRGKSFRQSGRAFAVDEIRRSGCEGSRYDFDFAVRLQHGSCRAGSSRPDESRGMERAEGSARASSLHGRRQSVLQPARPTNRRVAGNPRRNNASGAFPFRPRRLGLAPTVAAAIFFEIRYWLRQPGENRSRAMNSPRPAVASTLRSVTIGTPREIVIFGQPVTSNPSNGS